MDHFSQKIERVQIPNEDMPAWMEMLRENGFSDQETQSVLEYLNQEYAYAKNKCAVDKKLQEFLLDWGFSIGKPLTEKQKEEVRNAITDGLRNSKHKKLVPPP